MTGRPPLTPPDCDLRDFPRMMVDVTRLMGSQFNSTASRSPIAWMVGHKLWYRAWHQVPAASLPDDDEELCHLAELGFDMKTWRKAKDVALRGWVKCDDGRIYHPTVSEVALEAWIEKLLQRLSSGAGNAKRYRHAFDPAPLNAAIEAAATLLEDLNPRSRAFDKLKRRQNRSPTTDLPPGDDQPPTGSTSVDPPGSQGTGRGRGIVREEGSNDPSLSPGKPERASPKAKTPIAEGFPGEPEIAEAADTIRSAGVKLDAADHAKRFRGHALTNDRRVADWSAAWRSWVEIEIGKAPAAAGPKAETPVFRWDGPADVWDLAVLRMGPDKAAGYVGRCAWRDGALVCPSPTIAKGIRAELGRDLDALGYRLVEGVAA